jgi:hypothetical protein
MNVLQIIKWELAAETEVLREEPLRQPRIPHDPEDQIRANGMEIQRLTSSPKWNRVLLKKLTVAQLVKK